MVGFNSNSIDFSNLSTKEIAKALSEVHFADAIDTINNLEINQAVSVIQELPFDYTVELFDRPELESASTLLQLLPTSQAVTLLNAISADQATDLLQDMDPDTRKQLSSQLNTETRQAVQSLIQYPDDTAGSLMTTEYIAVPYTWTVQKTLQYIREVENSRETIYAIYIIDPKTNILLKAISLRQLITGDLSQKITDLASQREPITVSALIPQEELTHLFRRHDLLAVPVVDKRHQIIGIVTVDDVLDSMTDEMSKDAQQFGGVVALDKPYMSVGFFSFFKHRGIWLSILFISEMLTASAMQHYADDLEKAVVLSLFIPLIMSSGGNSGSQATSLIIRALALQQINLSDWWRILLRELSMGIALGAVLGIIGMLRIVIWQKSGFYDYGEHWFLLAITIALTLMGIVTWGCFAGSMLPLFLKLMRIDPALASAPFIATLVDVTGIVIYFSVAYLILHGTML